MAKVTSRLKNPPTEKQIELANRLRNKRLELGLSLQEVAERLGISKVTIQRYETLDIVNIPSDNIEKLASLYEVSPAYIMGWENTDESAEKSSINFLPSHQYTMVPYSVSAGALNEIESISNLPQISVPDAMLGRYAGNKNILLMTVNGESMNRIIKHESIIAVKTDIELSDLHDGDIVVVANSGEYTVKRFYNDTAGQRFIFRPDSDSPAFTDIVFSYDNCECLQLIGRVVMYNVFL